MNFTREPIIETIITPKEGNKLIVKNSKGVNAEQHVIDAVEVVSFGHSFFFRSLDRSKSFLLPVSDYELLEVKETRVVLKNANVDRSIKIGGGREASLKVARETVETPAEQVAETQPAAASMEQRLEKKRERRRHRRRRGQEERAEVKESVESSKTEELKESASTSDMPITSSEETATAAPIFSRLFPPPPTLISEKLGKTREKNADSFEKDVITEDQEERKKEKHEANAFIEENIEIAIEKEETPDAGSNTEMHRVMPNINPFDGNDSYSNQRSSWMDFFSGKNPFKN